MHEETITVSILKQDVHCVRVEIRVVPGSAKVNVFDPEAGTSFAHCSLRSAAT